MKNRDYREIRTENGSVVKLVGRPYIKYDDYSYQYGLDDISKKRKKPVFWMNADPDGVIFSEDSADNKNDWKGGFETYTDEYLLNIQAEHLGRFLERGFLNRINKKLFNDIKLGKVKIMFLNQCEGDHHDSILNDNIYNLLIKELNQFNIDESNVIYSDNNFIIETEFKKHYPNSKMNVLPHYWQLWRFLDCQTDLILPKDLLQTKDVIRDKHFLSYNRSAHPHRCAAGLEMFEYQLNKKGMVSFPSDIEGIEGNPFSIQEGIDMFYKKSNYNKDSVDNFRKDLPWIADVDGIFNQNNQWDSDVYRDSFLNTYFSFVVGSVFDSYHNHEPYSVFMSEKIYKPLTNFHPFLYMSNSGTLEVLKELGFKTFHPFIDESYDKEPDNLKRFNMIMSELKRLCNMKISELHNLYWQLSDTLIHNQNTYYEKAFPLSEQIIEDVLNIVME